MPEIKGKEDGMPVTTNQEMSSTAISGMSVSRRRFVKGAAVTAGAVVASGYVKPGMRSFGVPTALAVSPGGEEPPPPELGNACSLELSVTATCVLGLISGQVCLENVSDDDGSCEITAVRVLVEPKGANRRYGSCGSPEETLISLSSTGGTNSLDVGDIIPGPNGTTTCFTLLIAHSGIINASNGSDYKVHVIVGFGPHHQFPDGRETQVCTTVEC